MIETTKEVLKLEALIGKNPFERILPKVGAWLLLISISVVIHVDESQSLSPEVHWWLCLAKGRMVGWVGNHATMPCSVWWNFRNYCKTTPHA